MDASQREFGEPVGWNQAAVSAFEQGKVAFKKPDALAIEHVYGIRHEWLLVGEGPKTRDAPELSDNENAVLRIYRGLSFADRDTWLRIGSLLAGTVWDGYTERRVGERRQSERRQNRKPKK